MPPETALTIYTTFRDLLRGSSYVWEPLGRRIPLSHHSEYFQCKALFATGHTESSEIIDLEVFKVSKRNQHGYPVRVVPELR
jgi:hypothetical protein